MSSVKKKQEIFNSDLFKDYTELLLAHMEMREGEMTVGIDQVYFSR